MRIIISRHIIFFLCLCLPNILFAGNDERRQLVDALNETLAQKDTAYLKPYLSETFSISILSGNSVQNYLDQIVKHSETATGVSYVTDSTDVSGNVSLKVIFREPSQTIESIIGLNKENKITYIDYLDRLFGQSRHTESHLVTTIPFELLDNQLMLIHLKLNDLPHSLPFYLDTGADGMGISRLAADSLLLNTDETQNATVVGGQIEVQLSRGNKIHLGGVSFQNQSIGIFKEPVAEGVVGIIGLPIVREYITRIDFNKQEIQLYNFGEYAFETAGEVLDITMRNNLISLPASINMVGEKEVKGKFILDTGAHYHFIGFAPFVGKNRLLFSGFKATGKSTTTSLGISTPVYEGQMHEFKIGQSISIKNMPVSLQLSQAGINPELSPDGSIGIHLLKQYNITIDMLRKKIHFIPNK